jgi:hypothetical protein
MNLTKKMIICLVVILLAGISTLMAYKADKTPNPEKKLDLTKYHNVGNIWMRVSNFGFFGSGDDIVPQYPSLEYPGGSGVDYLYQGALWFGAKKYRRNLAGNKLYWLAQNPSADSSDVVAEGDTLGGWNNNLKVVIDTLVTEGFDGDKDLYEFLPAYNPLEATNASIQDLYTRYNAFDYIATASSRYQKRGVDDDGDGIIDEDFIGYTFPLRSATELPERFASFGGQYIYQTNNFGIVTEPLNYEIWFPLGFMELSDRSNTNYNFTEPTDDDGDGQIDEDGAPVSEQDFISYYYDYSPFGTPGERDRGQSSGTSRHIPLKVRVRQMSYQWSYEYIKNLVYVEFDITNMNLSTNPAQQDTLFDCAMGIYMDSDVGPQTYGAEKASDDLSGYVMGTGYEFAYTRDDDFDGGLSPGMVGSRVCTPDPELLRFSCWYWKVGDGPDDFNPQSLNLGSKNTNNEKYWLLTGRNPNPGSATKYQILRGGPSGDQPEYEQPSANDTRYLFAFYGAQPGTTDYQDPTKIWNLAPGRTMKIVIAVFPGDNLEDLKRSARWAKEIYGVAQTLTTVVLPDTFPHYNPPEPPEIPKLYAELVDDGNKIDLYWDNRSEFSYDVKTVSTAVIGWQDPNNSAFIPGLDSDPNFIDYSDFPAEFQPNSGNVNLNGRVNPYTGYRLRHDFQGYSTWGRSGSGSQEDWELVEKWDKIDSPVDLADYQTNLTSTYYTNYGGYMGVDKGLPNLHNPDDPAHVAGCPICQIPAEKTKFYRFNDYYQLVPVQQDDDFYGLPIYNPDVEWTPELQELADTMIDTPGLINNESDKALQAMLFKHPSVRDDVFRALYDDKLIPLLGHGGQVAIPEEGSSDTSKLIELRKSRLARRYYNSSIMYPPKGIEYYVAVTAFDRGIPSNNLDYLETGRDADANMKVFFPGSLAKNNMSKIYVVPNPYVGSSKFDGRRENDKKGDKSRRLWFVNLPERCKIRIYTLAGDLVDELDHDGMYSEDIINVSKATAQGLTASGLHTWDLLSKNNQIIASGVYLFSVENKATGDVKVGKFVIIK